MKLAALGLVALMAGAQAADDPRPPGRRAGIAGIAGFKTSSSITFVGAPDDPHRIDALYVFPDRARLTLRREGTSDRQIEYRFGERAYLLPPGTTKSTELVGDDRDVELRRRELRRAAMLWPDGFEWSGEGSVRTAPILRRTGDDPQHAIGTLHARLGDRGRPTRVEIRLPEGEPPEALEILGWREIGNRTWPAELRLIQHGETIWEERVETVRTANVLYVDSYFLPPDRKYLSPDESIRASRLRANTYRRHALPPGTSWEAALKREAELRRAAADELGGRRKLDAVPTFELRADGKPAAAILRLSEQANPPPEGWSTQAETQGISRILGGTAGIGPAVLDGLVDAVPPDRRAGTPFVRLYQEGKRVQVSIRVLAR